jgi:2-keto-4-pentenoate hydratase/2-oxohepta-3-ene-1,7-dioic acid hydratase in catechol pathway
MRLATWEYAGSRSSGVMIDGRVHAFGDGADLIDMMAAGGAGLADASDRATAAPGVPLCRVRLLPPVTPPSIRDFLAFHEHLEGVVARFGHPVPPAWYEHPTFYFSNPHGLVGAHDDVPIPPGCRVLDFELEVAAVIGTAGRDLTPAQAREHIFGYLVMNDWSARDLQADEMTVQLGPAKGKDFATTLGPCLVTADELSARRDADGFLDCEMTVEVNGVHIGSDTLASMSWTFEELVSYASRGTWVRPGDVIGSGTCGSGCLAELWGRRGGQDPPPLAAGDVVTMTVDGLGTIANRVVAGGDGVAVPRARTRPVRTRAGRR